MTDPAGYKFEKRLASRLSWLTKWILEYMASAHSEKYGLSNEAWRIFSIIEKNQPVFPGMIAKYSSQDPYNITRMVDRLVDQGLVSRDGDVKDRRRVVLRLTSRGQMVFDELDTAFEALDARLRGVLDGNEAATFEKALSRLETETLALLGSVGVNPSDPPSDKPAGSRTSASPAK